MDNTKPEAYHRGLYHAFARLNDQRHFYAVRHAFIFCTPIMIIAALTIFVNQFPLAAYQKWMLSFFGPDWEIFGNLARAATIQISALILPMAIGSNLADWYNNHASHQIPSSNVGILALANYIIVSFPLSFKNPLFYSMDPTGLFVATLISLISSEIFIRLFLRGEPFFPSVNSQKKINMGFSTLAPTIITILPFLLLRIFAFAFGIYDSLPHLVGSFLINLFMGAGSSLPFFLVFLSAINLMWFFGIPGSNMLLPVSQNALFSAVSQNIAAAEAGLSASNLVTKPFLDVFVQLGGSGATLSLVFALLIFGHTRNYHSMLKYVLFTAFFNINEALLFALPIIFNPVFAIPFLLTPLVNFGIASFATLAGLVPYTIAQVSWTTPLFISGYLATGSPAGAALQLVNLIVGILIYAPFVKLSERLMLIQFENNYNKLCSFMKKGYDPSSRKITHRNDSIGVTARNISLNLQNAISHNKLSLVYQPIVDLQSDSLYSVEALLRWEHPKYGTIDPMLTIALAEEIQQIDKLGLWIISEAVKQRMIWTQENVPPFRISVNVSTLQLTDSLFWKKVENILQRNNMPPHLLQLEITESIALATGHITLNNLSRLREIGVSIAMDDFGVGHASLMYLQGNKIQTVKIDGALIRDIDENELSREIVCTICRLCQQLSIQIVAEYVETSEQIKILLEIGLFKMQGYYFSPPLAPDSINAFCRQLPLTLKGIAAFPLPS